MFICDNCLQEYKFKSSLDNHKNNKRKKCNKVILNSDGTIQNKQPNQCECCYVVLSTVYVYKEHLRTCKKYIDWKKNELLQLKKRNQELEHRYKELEKELEVYKKIAKDIGIVKDNEIAELKNQLAQKDKQLSTVNINNNVVNNNVQIVNYNYHILAFYTIEPITESMIERVIESTIEFREV